MRMVNKLLEEQNKKKKRPALPDEPDEVEITVEMPAFKPINSSDSIFNRDIDKRMGGINTKPSVFDSKARFKGGE